MSYESNVHAGLDAARAGSVARRVELDDLRLAVFSDHHRGRRDRGDDFLRSAPAYHAALGYYAESGHALVLLGDVEELWGYGPADVLAAHERTIRLEAEFHEAGRLLRVFGNHDDLWACEQRTREHLGPRFPGLRVHESLSFGVHAQGRALGTLFLVHGHQGAPFSDRRRRIGKLVVGNLWGPLQRRLRQASNTPAHDSTLRERHDRALFRWATRQDRLVLIAGHTHRPVFMSESQSRKAMRELEESRLALASGADSKEARLRVARLRAELEWLRARGRETPSGRHRTLPERPCYFNAGCCSFADGDITGLELDEGQIRLVRWPDSLGRPRREVLATADLARDVFAALRHDRDMARGAAEPPPLRRLDEVSTAP